MYATLLQLSIGRYMYSWFDWTCNLRDNIMRIGDNRSKYQEILIMMAYKYTFTFFCMSSISGILLIYDHLQMKVANRLCCHGHCNLSGDHNPHKSRSPRIQCESSISWFTIRDWTEEALLRSNGNKLNTLPDWISCHLNSNAKLPSKDRRMRNRRTRGSVASWWCQRDLRPRMSEEAASRSRINENVTHSILRSASSSHEWGDWFERRVL